jgi:hypothetical protein
MPIADTAIWKLFAWLTSSTIDHLPTDIKAPSPTTAGPLRDYLDRANPPSPPLYL